MSTYTLYHNPRCSKSRQALSLLEEKNINPVIVEYLRTPPKVSELKKIIKLLNISPREIIRTKESLYKDLNLADSNLSDEDIIKNLCQHPILIERPIIFTNKQAVIGRPPENILELL